MVHPGTYSCTPKSHIPASGCGPRTIPDLCDHPISCIPALRSYGCRSLAPGRKGAEVPQLICINKHSSIIEFLAVAKTTAETGDQGIHQPIHHHCRNTWCNTDMTHPITNPDSACKSHRTWDRNQAKERADRIVANLPTAGVPVAQDSTGIIVPKPEMCWDPDPSTQKTAGIHWDPPKNTQDPRSSQMIFTIRVAP